MTTVSTVNGIAQHFVRFEKLETYHEDIGFLGKGSFGQVRKMRRKDTGRIVAVKSQLVDLDDISSTQLVNAESAILATLAISQAAQSLVNTEALIYDPPFLHICMEYMSGGDLSQLIKKRRAEKKPFSNAEAWSYFAQLVDALCECHSSVDKKGDPRPVVLHRDVKPSNVLVCEQGFVKIGDFGLSKLLIDDYTQTQCGTRAYMSPESLDGRPYTVKSDVYALGCLMHELCSFQLPFDRSYGSRDPRRVPSIPPTYDRSLDALIKKMIAYSPDDRPSSAELRLIEPIAEQAASVRQRRADLAYAQRQRELDDREEAIAQREQDLMSMRSFASDDDVYSERDATLIKREHDLDDKQNELVEQARMLAQRVTATNAVLDAIHGRLVELARTAGVVVKPEDDRETILSALADRLQQLQAGSSDSSMSDSRPRGGRPGSVRIASAALFDAVSARMMNLAQTVRETPESEIEDPMAAVRAGMGRLSRNLAGPLPPDTQMPGSLPAFGRPMSTSPTQGT